MLSIAAVAAPSCDQLPVTKQWRHWIDYFARQPSDGGHASYSDAKASNPDATFLRFFSVLT